MSGYRTRIMEVAVIPAGADTGDERVTRIRVADDGAGEFIEIVQRINGAEYVVAVDLEEWPTVRRAVDRMVRECLRESAVTTERDGDDQRTTAVGADPEQMVAELQAALGWPGGVSEPISEWRELVLMVDRLRVDSERRQT